MLIGLVVLAGTTAQALMRFAHTANDRTAQSFPGPHRPIALSMTIRAAELWAGHAEGETLRKTCVDSRLRSDSRSRWDVGATFQPAPIDRSLGFLLQLSRAQWHAVAISTGPDGVHGSAFRSRLPQVESRETHDFPTNEGSRTMRKLGLSVLALGLASMTGAAAADPVYGNWTQVSKGVYENVDATGVVTTMALGAEGAGYDREMIADKVAELTTKVASGRALGSDFEELRGWQDALEGFPVEEAAASIEPKTSNSGSLCNGYFAYAFDSHFVVGAGGASAVARLAFGIPAFGPPPILNSITKYNSATVTPQSGWGSPTTSSYTRTTTNPNPVAFASWLHPDYGNVGPITSTRCSASSYSYIQLSSAVCAGGTAFISQSKSYPTCVSAP